MDKSNFKKIILVVTCSCMLSIPCYASGHLPGLELLPIVFGLMIFAALTVLLNIIALLRTAISSSRPTTMLQICLVLNILWLLFCLWVIYKRYQEHLDYYSQRMDKEGFANFISKASSILLFIFIAIVLDIVLISQRKEAIKEPGGKEIESEKQ